MGDLVKVSQRESNWLLSTGMVSINLTGLYTVAVCGTNLYQV